MGGSYKLKASKNLPNGTGLSSQFRDPCAIRSDSGSFKETSRRAPAQGAEWVVCVRVCLSAALMHFLLFVSWLSVFPTINQRYPFSH